MIRPPPSTAWLSTWSTSTPRARTKAAMPSGRAYGPENRTSARREELPVAGNASGTLTDCTQASGAREEADAAAAAGAAAGAAGTPGG